MAFRDRQPDFEFLRMHRPACASYIYCISLPISLSLSSIRTSPRYFRFGYRREALPWHLEFGVSAGQEAATPSSSSSTPSYLRSSSDIRARVCSPPFSLFKASISIGICAQPRFTANERVNFGRGDHRTKKMANARTIDSQGYAYSSFFVSPLLNRIVRRPRLQN